MNLQKPKPTVLQTAPLPITGLPTQKRCTQDSNLQALTGQRFSRPLPHHPDTRHNMEMWLLGFEPKSSDSQSEVLTCTMISQAKSCPDATHPCPCYAWVSLPSVETTGTLPHYVRAIPWLLYDSHSDPSGTRTRHFRLERPVNWPFIRWDHE